MADSNLRARNLRVPKGPDAGLPSPTGKIISREKDKAKARRSRIGVFDVVRVLLGAAALSTVFSYFITGTLFWNRSRPIWTRPAWVRHRLSGDLLLTHAELAEYDGTDTSKPIYIGLNGTIYDVSASPHYYGPGGGYHHFAGVDATRAFVTGCFAEDRTDDLRGVELIFMPVDLDRPPVIDYEEMYEDEIREERRMWKTRRERARRAALKKVDDSIRSWEASFSGEKDKYKSGKTKYFRVGRVVVSEEEKAAREEEPIPTLCPRARNMRPKKAEDLGI